MTIIHKFQYNYRLSPLYSLLRPIKLAKDYLIWEINGRNLQIPHLLKQRLVKEYARTFNLETLIETGTYLGDMVYATMHSFNKIISIEIGKDYYKHAAREFARYPYIQIVCGDSGKVLPEILPTVHQPCIFWIDAHYCATSMTARGDTETPIMQELTCILERHGDRYISNRDVILIDDANWYTGSGDYPPLNDVIGLIKEKWPEGLVTIRHNVICAYPNSSPDLPTGA